MMRRLMMTVSVPTPKPIGDVMCSACCGEFSRRAAKNTKKFSFKVVTKTIKPQQNAVLDGMLKMGWRIVKEAHVPGTNFYTRTEMWCDSLYLLQKGDGFTVLMNNRRPISGHTAVYLANSNPRSKAIAAKVRVPNSAVRIPREKGADYAAHQFRKQPWSRKATLPEMVAHLKAKVEGLKKASCHLDKSTAQRQFNKLLESWGGAPKGKTTTITVRSKTREDAEKLFTRRGWEAKHSHTVVTKKVK